MAKTGRVVRGRFEPDDGGATFELASFDYEVIAQQLAEQRKIVQKTKKATTTYTLPAIKTERLSNAITAVSVSDTYEGSSTLTISLADPDFELYEFFDINRDGKLDKIELQYPPGSANWWRLTQLGISESAGQALQLTLTFMERPIVLLLHKRGPKKASRGRYTRAEFLRSCVKDVKLHPLKFVSQELHKKQPIAGTTPVDPPDTRRPAGPDAPTPPSGDSGNSTGGGDTNKGPKTKRKKHDKRKGIHKGDDLTVKGIKAKEAQLENGEALLEEAEALNAPHDAAVALIMTAIAESNLIDQDNQGGSVYSGVLQGNPSSFDVHNERLAARYCLQGGHGYNAPEGGLIGGVKAMNKDTRGGAQPYRSLGHLCYVNQGCRANFGSDAAAEEFFQKHQSEAEEWVVGGFGGGFRGGTDTYRAQYNFQIGDAENPKEKYWDGMVELAKEVRWRLFCDGRTIYFDSDTTLARQTPAAIIWRTDPTVVGYEANWDGERAIATEMTLDLICEPFEFRAGQVFKLKGFGPLSRGSTVKPDPLPGRWLIAESERDSGSYVTRFTLRQPELPKKEPDAEQREVHDDGASHGGSLRDVDDTMSPKEIIDELVLPVGRKHDAKSLGKALTPQNVRAANAGHGATSSGNRSDHQGPPESAWAVDLGFPGSYEGHEDPKGDGLADELARKFGFTVHHNHVYDFGTDDQTKDGLRYQLGWRVGGHHDHVHFGIKVVDPSKRKSSDEDSRGAPGYDKGGGPD